MDVPLLFDDLDLHVDRRISERRLDREPVELRLRQRERPLLLDRVLGRENEERLLEPLGHALDRHLLLGHRFEQRRLRLRHRAVDLVDEQHVCEDRARAELELARPLVEDRQAGDVGRLQIGRALDARERCAGDADGQRARQHRLRGAGHVLEEDVPAGDQRREDEPNLVRLSVHDPLDVGGEPRRKLHSRRQALVVGAALDSRLHPGNDTEPQGSVRPRSA